MFPKFKFHLRYFLLSPALSRRRPTTAVILADYRSLTASGQFVYYNPGLSGCEFSLDCLSCSAKNHCSRRGSTIPIQLFTISHGMLLKLPNQTR